MAFSCTTTYVLAARRQKPGPYTGRVCVSSAKPIPSTGPATPPCASNGYGPNSPLDPETAAAIVWLDALTTNVDRTPRNPNLLTWHGQVWLIDHGAALYRHHAPDWPGDAADRPFPQIRDHVLLPRAASIVEADERRAPLLSDRVIEEAVGLVPDDLLGDDPTVTRVGYIEHLAARLSRPRAFAAEAEEARTR